MKDETFTELLGKTATTVTRAKRDVNEDDMWVFEDKIIFNMDNGEQYELYHEQDCCESVWIEDITGELSDLEGEPLLMAEEVTNRDEPPVVDERYPDSTPESYTWSYYKFATIKGYVTIRFYGESNGYYSETASLVHTTADGTRIW